MKNQILKEDIPCLPQRQDSLLDQLHDLILTANRLGMYDAADAVIQLIPQIPTIKYACYVEEYDGGSVDSCVLDNKNPGGCVYALHIKNKEECKYWRIKK